MHLFNVANEKNFVIFFTFPTRVSANNFGPTANSVKINAQSALSKYPKQLDKIIRAKFLPVFFFSKKPKVSVSADS